MHDTVTASLGPVGPLLRWLTPWPKGVSAGETQSLKDDVKKLCVSLMDHSEAEEPSSMAVSWMSEIRELCYDIKNFLDDDPFIWEQDEDAQLTPEEKQEITQLKFKTLKSRAAYGSERLERYKIHGQNVNRAKFLSDGLGRLPILHAELVDRARMDSLAKKVMCTAEEKVVVSLVGLEGVGKTTLAKRLYHKMGVRFHCGAFVRVSPKPDMRMLLTSISTQIQLPGFSGGVSEDACSLDAQHLIKSIEHYLQDKRYLIIIDDLWSVSAWDIIRRAFPDGVCGSRIITTTQFEDVASACCSYSTNYIFQMKPLKDDQPRKLFFSLVFGSEDHVRCSDDHVTVLNEIINKCGGLPLLIVNIASLFPTPSELDLQRWIEIQDCLPSTMGINHISDGIKEVLNLIYNNMSPELKTCLLYLAMYPEGYTVDKKDLVKQWAAEGFTGEGQNKEENAGRYFDELVSRGMIQVIDINYKGVMSCTLHHMIHDLIVRKSMEINFVTCVDYFQSAVWLPDKVRRLSVQFGGARSARLPAGITLSEIRSLAFFGFYECADFIEKCKLLRVLALHVWADDFARQSKESLEISPSREKNVFTYDLPGISTILGLRYLKIACNIAVKLPDDIQALQYLETLEVDASVVAIPSDIGRLSKLSSLHIAVRVLLRQDICILQALPALSALSLHLWAEPVEMIYFDKGEFSVLKYFKFGCSVPWLKFEAGSMPDLQNLNLYFDAHEADQHGIVPIGIENLTGLDEISANIWGADIDVGSAFRAAISKHPSSPRINVQLVDSRIFCSKTAPSMSKDDDKGVEEKKQAADSRMYTSTSSSSRVPIPGKQSQIVCLGCRSLLLYPRGAASVCCAVCNAVTSPSPPGMEMAQLICVGCRTLLMYIRNATAVKCSCCDTVNDPARPAPPGKGYLLNRLLATKSPVMDPEHKRSKPNPTKQLTKCKMEENDIRQLREMASRLGAMLNAEGRKERDAWLKLRGKLVEFAAHLSIFDSNMATKSLLSYAIEEFGNLGLGLPEAETLLCEMMMTIGRIGAGNSEAILPKDLVMLVADELSMIPLCESNHKQMIEIVEDKKEKQKNRVVFHEHNIDNMISGWLSSPNKPYGVLSIVGAQSSGKSYLLNELFGSNFPVMDKEAEGWTRTTKGILMSRCIGPSLLILDVEGFDSEERGEDKNFENQAALFALTVSDIMMVNIAEQDINRNSGGGKMLFQTIFQERIKLPERLTKMLVVLRRCDSKTNSKVLDSVTIKLKKMWTTVHEKAERAVEFEKYIEVKVVALPDKEMPGFHTKVTELRKHISDNTLDHNKNGDNTNGNVPLSSFTDSSKRVWDEIKENKKLDFPSIKMAFTKLYCQQIVKDALISSISHKELLEAEISPQNFKTLSDKLLENIMAKFDKEMIMYDEELTKEERADLIEKIQKIHSESCNKLLQVLRKTTYDQFKIDVVINLKNMEETGIMEYDVEMVETCRTQFSNLCDDLKEFDVEYFRNICAELQKELYSYTQFKKIELKEQLARNELASERGMTNKERDLMKRLDDSIHEKKIAAAEMKFQREKQEHDQKMATEAADYSHEMLMRLHLQEMPRMQASLGRKTERNHEMQMATMCHIM